MNTPPASSASEGVDSPRAQPSVFRTLVLHAGESHERRAARALAKHGGGSGPGSECVGGAWHFAELRSESGLKELVQGIANADVVVVATQACGMVPDTVVAGLELGLATPPQRARRLIAVLHGDPGLNRAVEDRLRLMARSAGREFGVEYWSASDEASWDSPEHLAQRGSQMTHVLEDILVRHNRPPVPPRAGATETLG